MEYPEALRKIYGLAPMGMSLGLDRFRSAAKRLGSPHLDLRCTQIAGTNGKGSVACMIDAAARQAGLNVGLFTSPHLHRFTERIRIDGKEASQSDLAPILKRVFDIIEGRSPIPLTFFEVATLAALALFAERGVDLAVLEVGLGGRLDATSICVPAVTVVTSIGLDHTNVLGNSLKLIAGEKGAIARRGSPMITGPLQLEAMSEIERISQDRGAPLMRCGVEFMVDETLCPPWPGTRQLENSAVALEAFVQLGRSVDPRLDEVVFRSALPGAVWPGRFEILEVDGRKILDGAHNAEAVEALVEALARAGEKPAHILFGVLDGKPVDQMMRSLLSLGVPITMAPPPLDRAADHVALANRFCVGHAPDIGRALETLAGNDGTLLVTGSLFTVAEARRILLGEPADPPVGL